MSITSFKQLDVWKKAHQAVMDVYRITETFPDTEKFGLTSQMRRAAVSVPTNIAEGFARRKPNDKARFYTIAEGSTSESSYLVFLAREFKYVKDASALESAYDDIGKMLRRLTDKTLGN